MNKGGSALVKVCARCALSRCWLLLDRVREAPSASNLLLCSQFSSRPSSQSTQQHILFSTTNIPPN